MQVSGLEDVLRRIGNSLSGCGQSSSGSAVTGKCAIHRRERHRSRRERWRRIERSSRPLGRIGCRSVQRSDNPNTQRPRATGKIDVRREHVQHDARLFSKSSLLPNCGDHSSQSEQSEAIGIDTGNSKLGFERIRPQSSRSDKSARVDDRRYQCRQQIHGSFEQRGTSCDWWLHRDIRYVRIRGTQTQSTRTPVHQFVRRNDATFLQYAHI